MTDRDEFLLAEEYYNNEEYEEAFRRYKILADKGSVDSQVFLGWMCQNGLGVQKDFDKAFTWYENAAKLGSSEGQFYLAKSYARHSEFTKAKDWYSKAAEKNYSPAIYRLGWIYDTGRGVTVDKEKAFLCYKKAADLGHIFAKKQLAILLIKGHRGFYSRLYGVLIFIKCIVLVVLLAAKDPYSERLRD